MSFLKKILVIFFLLFPFSHTFANVITLVDEFQISNGLADTTVRAGLETDTDREVGGVQFNDDGTKMFVRFFRDEDGGADPDTEDFSYIDEYNLSIPFDASSGTYAGDDERCELDHSTGIGHQPFDLNFSSDGMKFYIANRDVLANGQDRNFIYRFDLTVPYDISTCSFAQRTRNIGNFINGSRAGDSPNALGSKNNRTQGVSLSNDGKKMFVLMSYGHVLEYNLSTAFDVTSFSLNVNGGMDLSSNTSNPQSIEFNADGTRIFIANHGPANNPSITQVSLNSPFDTSSFTVDGRVDFNNSTLGTLRQIRTLTFSNSGLIMYVGNDDSNSSHPVDKIFEFNLACPFDIIGGNCPSITENSDRTGMALAQIEIAKRTIDHSTDTALNRLKWIRRNKDEQNLTNLNIDFNFTNQKLASLTEVVKTSAAKKKTKDKEEDVFYWSEGSISIGRIGDTSISSTKKIGTNAITIGADRFTDENGIKGLAFRLGRNNVDVGSAGSNLDTDTYNITYYSTSPIEDDTKFLDSVIGYGKLKSSLLTVIDGRDLTANRSGHQIYGTIRIKDEIKKDNITFIPSGRFDIGHTILGSYKESGSGGIDVEKQHVRSKKIRAGLSAVEDISNEKYIIKRHGKLEYVVDVDRSSDFKYTYVGDKSQSFNDILHSEALHNINGEIGIDIVLPDRFSIFLIYERNQAIGSGHTDKIHIAIGYLPNKETNYAFSIDGSDNLKSNYVISKNINDFIIDFKLTNDLLRPEDLDEAFLNLSRKF
jgi:hypothetical protein